MSCIFNIFSYGNYHKLSLNSVRIFSQRIFGFGFKGLTKLNLGFYESVFRLCEIQRSIIKTVNNFFY